MYNCRVDDNHGNIVNVECVVIDKTKGLYVHLGEVTLKRMQHESNTM